MEIEENRTRKDMGKAEGLLDKIQVFENIKKEFSISLAEIKIVLYLGILNDSEQNHRPLNIAYNFHF